MGDCHSFPPFRLDAKNEQLWRGNREIRLRRKTFAVLRYLVERPGESGHQGRAPRCGLADVSVSDTMPAIQCVSCVALGDSADSHVIGHQGRGYRFIAPVTLESATARAPGTPSPQSLTLRAARNAFVGRERERSELSSALTDAISGQGRICLISGEPGIGKSRLCAEVADKAQGAGMAVMVGHCYEQESVPYLPFIEILESSADRSQSPDQLRAMLGEDGPELARLLPRLRRTLPDLPPALESSPESGRRHLFDSVYNFIARRGVEKPRLLILEDLHWADESSLALLSHLSQRLSDLPLLIVATHRSSEVEVRPELSRTLEDLVRGRLATQLRLEGLPADDVALMLKDLGGQNAPHAVVSEIYTETGGNPFFVEELFRHLAEEDQLFDVTGKYRHALKIDEHEVPQNVRLVVGRRFARLGDATARLLGVAAIIGRTFTYGLLEASSPTKGEGCLIASTRRAGRVDPLEDTPFEAHRVRSRTHPSGGAEPAIGRMPPAAASEVAEAIERIYGYIGGSLWRLGVSLQAYLQWQPGFRIPETRRPAGGASVRVR